MEFNRKWAMPNKNTFTIKPINELLRKYVHQGLTVVDPFANESKWGTITNDLNPEFGTTYHMDALDFLKQIDSNSADVVLYDPPYSLRQVSESYKGFGIVVTQETTQASWRARHLDEIARILKPRGKAICFGWNSNGVGKKRNMELIELLIVPHGGSKYDTLVTVEIKKAGDC
jgi:DNA modification methylase